MKAMVYDRNARAAGVSLRIVPKPTLVMENYQPDNLNIFRYLCLQGIYLIGYCSGIMLSIFRKLFPSIPGVYGRCDDRHYVLCKVMSAGVNPVDAKRLYGDKVPECLQKWVEWFVDNRICGIDFSGIVVEAPNYSRYKVGDEVYGTIPPFHGSFAEYVRAPSDFISHKPKCLKHYEAAVVPLVGLTTLQVFEDNLLSAGQHVLVIGASGGTGHVAVQIAKIKGAIVTAICSKKNAAFVITLGADHIISYDDNEHRLEDVLRRIVKEVGVFNIVFDSVSSHDPRDRVFPYEDTIRNSQPAMLEPGRGMYITIGGLYQDWFRAHCKRYLGVNLDKPNRMLFWIRFPNSSEHLARLGKYCDEGKLKVVVAKRFRMEEADVQNAFDEIMSRKIVGKLVVEMSD